MMSSLFDRLRGSDVPEDNGDPIADALKSGRNSEYLEGEIEEFGDHPVRVSKFYQWDDDEASWVVKIDIPNGPRERYVTRYYSDQFTAEAVFEKLQREYDLESWTPGDDDDE